MIKKLSAAILSLTLAIVTACLSITCAFAASASSSELEVNTISNLFEKSSATLSESQEQVRVTFELCLTKSLINTECEVIYDPAVLSPVKDTSENAVPNLENECINFCEIEGKRANSDKYGEDDPRRVVVFNSTSLEGSDFSTQKTFVTILFDVVDRTAGNTDVELWVKYLGVAGEDTSAIQYVVNDNGVVSSDLYSSVVKSAVSELAAIETTNPTDETTNPTTPSTEPTDESTNPTAPSTEPTDESTDPTTPSTTVPSTTVPVTYPDPTMLGDVNGDGAIDISDATMIQKSLAQIITLNDKQKAAAEVNGDETVDISDATTIQKYLAKIIDKF